MTGVQTCALPIFYLRKKTLAECEYRLKTTDDPRDMSELVEELMAGWLGKSAK